MHSEKSLSQLVPVCVDCKEQVLQCLKAQPSRPLMCSSEVQAYTQCVARARKVSKVASVVGTLNMLMSLSVEGVY